MHPLVGPAAEAETLYVRQIGLRERLASHAGEFVIWDVGLGAAANVLTVLRLTRDLPAAMRVLSFDHSSDSLRFALGHVRELAYLEGFESASAGLVEDCAASFENGAQTVDWRFLPGDFPTLVCQPEAGKWAKPHVILFDPFSPAKNPGMFTAPLFAALFQLLDPARPCVMPTYSRSTMLRVSLLLAGFFVGRGPPSGAKEETTVAANQTHLIAEPLGYSWLKRVRISTSAEPLWEPVYRQAPLAAQTWERLRRHPQFA